MVSKCEKATGILPREQTRGLKALTKGDRRYEEANHRNPNHVKGGLGEFGGVGAWAGPGIRPAAPSRVLKSVCCARSSCHSRLHGYLCGVGTLRRPGLLFSLCGVVRTP